MEPGDTIRYEFSGYEEGLKLFDSLNYTPEAWQSGNREVPNLHISHIPERWRERTSKEIEIKLKKQVFFRIIAPLALAVNEEIRQEREELEKIMSRGLSDLSASQFQWLERLAEAYKVTNAGSTISEDQVTELRKRVDQVPLSLVLAQSAEESGWGTSRFAAEGNALFGQWAWGKNAMKPKEQRSGMGDYGLARFDSPLESMRAYMRNLNSHTAYQSLRDARAELREQGKTPDGVSLARTLTRYSERGEEYVNTLLGIMRINNLATADEAYLKKDPVILFIPVE